MTHKTPTCARTFISRVVSMQSLMRTCIISEMIPATERRAWEKRNRQDAATWWIQALQMRSAQTSREERGEVERQRPKERRNVNEKKRGEIQSSASKQIKEKCEKQKQLIKKKKGGVRDWLLLQLAELVLLLLELASQGFVSCHLLCDLRTRTLGAKHKARVLVNVVGCARGGWGRISRHGWWQVRRSMPPHYSYSGRVEGAKRG